MILLGTPPLGLRTLAADVLRAAVAAQARAVEEAPTDDLFDLMVEQGRIMRRETHRLHALQGQ